jgi:hypothetical protein
MILIIKRYIALIKNLNGYTHKFNIGFQLIFLKLHVHVLYATVALDSISSCFNVFNTPISTTAPIDAKTLVSPIDGIAQ